MTYVLKVFPQIAQIFTDFFLNQKDNAFLNFIYAII